MSSSIPRYSIGLLNSINRAMKKAEERLANANLSSDGEELLTMLTQVEVLQDHINQTANNILRNTKDPSDMEYVLDLCAINTYLRDDEGNRYIKVVGGEWGFISGDGIDEVYRADEIIGFPTTLTIVEGGIRVD